MSRHLEVLNAGDGIEGEVQAGEAGECGQALHAAQLIEAESQHLQAHRALQPLHQCTAHLKACQITTLQQEAEDLLIDTMLYTAIIICLQVAPSRLIVQKVKYVQNDDNFIHIQPQQLSAYVVQVRTGAGQARSI